MSSWSEEASSLPCVLPIRRIRVLLLSSDRRFLRVTAFLLRRKGFVVESAARPDVALVKRHRPDVVVIDGNGSVRDAVRSLAEIEARWPAVAFLVVSEEALERRGLLFRFLPKWSAGDRLAAEVERAYFRLEPA
jgi:chemotaxis response regulator CheB